MPPGGGSCPECEQKIILNGDITARVLDSVCERIDQFVAKGNTFSDPVKLVNMANKLEDDAFAFAKEAMSQIGFKGPWPKSMQ